ncbi:hypothetical protein HER21_37985, partial [Pseudomonas sp. BGM005]|nr:hypothetical protein [Pseudomonas sp. BG5]
DALVSAPGLCAPELSASGRSGAATPPRAGFAREYRRFVPFSIDEVRRLLSSPERWLDWNDFEAQSTELMRDGVVHAQTRERHVDGRPARLKPAFATTDHRIRPCEMPDVIEWVRSF